MGVDYYVCDHCRETFPDCGRYDSFEAGHMICDRCTRHVVPWTPAGEDDDSDGTTDDGELLSSRCPVCVGGGTTEEVYLGALKKIAACRGEDRSEMSYMIQVATEAIAKGMK